MIKGLLYATKHIFQKYDKFYDNTEYVIVLLTDGSKRITRKKMGFRW